MTRQLDLFKHGKIEVFPPSLQAARVRRSAEIILSKPVAKRWWWLKYEGQGVWSSLQKLGLSDNQIIPYIVDYRKAVEREVNRQIVIDYLFSDEALG